MRCPWKVWRNVRRLEMLARTGMCSRAHAIFIRPAGASFGSLILLKSGFTGKWLGNISLCQGSGPVCIIRDGLHGLQNLCGRVRVRCPFRGSGLGLGIRTLR